MKWYFDTSVIVAASVVSHPHHAGASAVLDAFAAEKHGGFLSGHSLAEIYSVLTRAPFPLRFRPAEVMKLIEVSVLSCMKLVTLDAREYEDVVRLSVTQGWIGGRVYDAIYVECAKKSACDRLYTFNVKDFVALSPAELVGKVVSP